MAIPDGLWSRLHPWWRLSEGSCCNHYMDVMCGQDVLDHAGFGDHPLRVNWHLTSSRSL